MSKGMTNLSGWLDQAARAYQKAKEEAAARREERRKSGYQSDDPTDPSYWDRYLP